METVGDVLKKYHERKEKREKMRSERADLIRQFTEAINAERDGVKYKKLKPAFIAFRLSHIKKLSDLYAFLSMCNDRSKRGQSFSKYFWWAIKAQEDPQKHMF